MRFLKDMIRRRLKSQGLLLVPEKSILSLENALARHAAKAEIRTVIDIGASDGSWSEAAMRHFPRARYLLIEAQANPHLPRLEAFKSLHPNADFCIAAAGHRLGKIHFNAGDPFGGKAADTPFAKHDIEVPVTTVDHEAAARKLEGPFLLKLDTHGFEVPIFEGAAETLTRTALIVVEVYNFKISPEALRFHELCAYLEERGFRPLDILDITHRPGDGALWQMDLVFARADRPEFADNEYS